MRMLSPTTRTLRSEKVMYFLLVLTARQSALADFLDTKTQGAVVRSRYRSVDQMDAPEKMILVLKRKMY